MRHCLLYLLFCLALRLASQDNATSFSVVRHIGQEGDDISNTIYQVAFDAQGKCYLAGNKGLSSYDGFSLQNFRLQDGLFNREIFNVNIQDSILYFLPLKGGLYAVNYLTDSPVFARYAQVEGVLKDLVVQKGIVHFSTYSSVFSASPGQAISRQIYFDGQKNRLFEFEDNFYLRSPNSFSKLDLNTGLIDTILKYTEAIKTFSVYRNTFFYSKGDYFYAYSLANERKDSARFNLFPFTDLPDEIWPVNDSVFFMNINNQLLSVDWRNGKSEVLLSQVSINTIVQHPKNDLYFVCTQNSGLYILKKSGIQKVERHHFTKNISYFDVADSASACIGLSNGEVFFDGRAYQTPGGVNAVCQCGNRLFVGLDKGLCVKDLSSGKTLYENLNSTVKKAVACDSVVYYTTSNSLRRISMNNFSIQKIISANHRSYYLQSHSGSLYTQSYNTDTLFRIDPPHKKVNALGFIKGQIVRSIELNNTIYFITDVAHLYCLKQNQLTDIYLPDHLPYPVNKIRYFEQHKGYLIIGNNDFMVAITFSDLEHRNYVFTPLRLPIPNEAIDVHILDGKIIYPIQNTLYSFPLESNIQKKEACSVILTKKSVNSDHASLFSGVQGRVMLDLEFINYSGHHPMLTCYVISNGKIRRLTQQALSRQLVIDSLPAGISGILCLVTDDRLNAAPALYVPVYVSNDAAYQVALTLAAYSLGILLIAFLIFRYIVNNLKKQHQLKMELILTEQKAGALLMNPHFVFNALGNLQGFIRSNQLSLANTYLLKFSTVIRSYLNFMKKGMVSLAHELESIRHFIDFQNIKHNGRLELEITQDEDIQANRISIPAFVLQPFVENSIKYFADANPILFIRIHIGELTGNSYTISITDNGPGLNKDIHDSIFEEKHQSSDFRSIAFTLQRIHKVHDANKLPFDYTISNRYEGNHVAGLSVILRLSMLPYQPDEEY